ncbi:MAG: glucose 1-dehydrogenase [Dehalococcoidia bacterium]|nr:glucose 1-dehydrogenase [Dehalococcoidia bacterium]
MNVSLFSLSGRTAAVTGAGRGIGRTLALALADAGADVAISDIDGDAAKLVEQEVKKKGRRSLSVVTDVTDVFQVDGMVGCITEEWGHIDILINNAGINLRKPILELEPEEFDRVYNVNLKGVLICSKRIAREMVAQGYGKIINIASLTAVTIVQGMQMSPYYVTKAGVVQLTKAAAAEWGAHGVCVNAISPGWFISDINRDLWNDPAYMKSRLDHTPLGRIGKFEDLAGTAVFLASSASDFITGQNIVVDGGFSVW